MKYSAYYVEENDGEFSSSISELELQKPEDGFVQIVQDCNNKDMKYR